VWAIQKGHVTKVINGFVVPSAAFKDALGKLLADLLLGELRNGPRAFPK
jgi:hypothetical protein